MRDRKPSLLRRRKEESRTRRFFKMKRKGVEEVGYFQLLVEMLKLPGRKEQIYLY